MRCVAAGNYCLSTGIKDQLQAGTLLGLRPLPRLMRTLPGVPVKHLSNAYGA